MGGDRDDTILDNSVVSQHLTLEHPTTCTTEVSDISL